MITIERTSESGGRAWRAIVRLPDFMSGGMYICGGATKEGPWVEGYGFSAGAALDAAKLKIGDAVIAMTKQASEETTMTVKA